MRRSPISRNSRADWGRAVPCTALCGRIRHSWAGASSAAALFAPLAPSWFALLTDHVSAAAQAASTVWVSSSVGWCWASGRYFVAKVTWRSLIVMSSSEGSALVRLWVPKTQSAAVASSFVHRSTTTRFGS